MAERAAIESTPEGSVPVGKGWFVINAAESRWHETDRFGSACSFEGDVSFNDYGVNIHVIEPGQPNCLYHREDVQEDFLVLEGECHLIVEGEELHLRPWDFFHCPADTTHVFVGAGDKPCAILMIGGRAGYSSVTYPVDPVAQKHNAGVDSETNDPKVAYADCAPWNPTKGTWPLKP